MAEGFVLIRQKLTGRYDERIIAKAIDASTHGKSVPFSQLLKDCEAFCQNYRETPPVPQEELDAAFVQIDAAKAARRATEKKDTADFQKRLQKRIGRILRDSPRHMAERCADYARDECNRQRLGGDYGYDRDSNRYEREEGA